MASIRNLKKDLNYVTAGIIEAAYIQQILNPNASTEQTEAIVDEAIAIHGDFIREINNKNVENRSAHLKEVNQSIEKQAQDLVAKLNAL
ncbi:MAG: hypothetical protein ACTJGD_03875 [Mesonia hippocampi]|uniref:hypothetical protein n=1 Tax=Mesonia hippocampi TaxID=1628250 RepID=UPI003F9DD814